MVCKLKNNYKRTQSSIGKIYKKEEEKEKKRELEEKGFCPISIKYPKRAKENSKNTSSPHPKSEGLLETQKKIIKSSRSKNTKSSSTRFKLQQP